MDAEVEFARARTFVAFPGEDHWVVLCAGHAPSGSQGLPTELIDPLFPSETWFFKLGTHHVDSSRYLIVIRLKFHHGIDTIVSAIDHNRLACDIAGVA